MLTLLLNVLVDSAAILYSGSLVGQLLLPGWPLWLIVAVLAGAAGLYTVMGGLRAVIYTEAVQAVVLLAGALLISIGAFHRAGGWHAVMSSVDPAFISLIRPLNDAGVPWPGLLFGIPLLGFYYWCTNQSIVQRMLSAKNIDHARWGALLAGLLKLPILFLIVLPGTCALVLFPHLPRADMVYPNLILRVLPSGLIGLVVAGFHRRDHGIDRFDAQFSKHPHHHGCGEAIAAFAVGCRSRAHWKVDHRRAVCRCHCLGRRSCSCSLPCGSTFRRFYPMRCRPWSPCFLAGMFWRGANADGAAAALRWGSVAGVAFFLTNVVFAWTHLHFLYVAPILCVIDMAILVVVSKAAWVDLSASSAATMWTRSFTQAEHLRLQGTPAWQDYRFQSVGLLLLTGIIVYWFR